MWKFGTPAKPGDYFLTICHKNEKPTTCNGMWADGDWVFMDGEEAISRKDALAEGLDVAEVIAYMDPIEPARVLHIDVGPSVVGWAPKVFRMWWQGSNGIIADPFQLWGVEIDAEFRQLGHEVCTIEINEDSVVRAIYSGTEDIFMSLLQTILYKAPGKGVKVCITDNASTGR